MNYIFVSSGVVVSVVYLGALLGNQPINFNLKNQVVYLEYGSSISTNINDYLVDNSEMNVLENATLDIPELNKNDYVVDEKKNVIIPKNAKNIIPVGEYSASIAFATQREVFKIIVHDTTSPLIKTNTTNIDVIVGEDSKLDYRSNFTCSDLSICNVHADSSEVDTSKVGTYKVYGYASDASNNKSSKLSYVVNVVAKPEEEKEAIVEPTEPVVPASPVVKKIDPCSVTAPVANYDRELAKSYSERLNEHRVANGLQPLAYSCEAQIEADRRAIAITTDYRHNASADYGENIGYATIGLDILQAWKESPSHNSNMLDNELYSSFAISIVESNGRIYAVTSFRAKWA